MEKEKKLLDTLKEIAPDSSITTCRKWLKQGRVSLDGQVITNANTPVKKGQKVAISAKEKSVEGGIKILFEDRDLVVIFKPHGLLSVATAFQQEKTAHALLKLRFKRVYPVHRLDQNTSGVMIFALTERARDAFKEIFESHTIERSYLALVEGTPEDNEGVLRDYLFEDANYHVHVTDGKGKLGITHYEVLDKGMTHTLLKVTLETGRKNQIRAQFQHAGFPIAGDKKYGGQTDPLQRLCLHAYKLGFTHPITKKPMLFEASPEEDFSVS